MDVPEEPIPAKRRCISRNEDNMQLIQCVREFQLPQQFPSVMKQTMNTVVTDERNERSRVNIENSLAPSLIIPVTTKISSMQNTIPFKLRKLRILALDGRDLGEFNVELRVDDLSNRHKIIITKSCKFKPTKKQVTIALPSHPTSSRIFPQICKEDIVKRPKCNLIGKTRCDNISEANKLQILQQQKQQKQEHILPIQGIVMHVQDARASKQVSNNSFNKVLSVSGNGAIPKTFMCQAAVSNDRNVVYNLMNNAQNSLKIQEIKTENNKSFSGTNISVSDNYDSLFPVVGDKNFTSQYSDNNYSRMSAYSKGKCIATIKNTKGGKIVTSLSAVKSKECSKINKDCTVDHLDSNNRNSLNYQGVSSNKNNLLHDKPNIASKNNQVHEIKLQENVMTVIPNSENCLHKPNMALIQDCNVTTSSVINKTATYVNHSKITCSRVYDNTQSKQVLKKTRENDNTCQRDALSNCAAAQYTPHLQKAADNSANVQLNLQRNENGVQDLPQKDLLKQLEIIKKAMDSVKDNELRELALQALADCGIGIERYVPIQPQKYKTVHDTQMQTTIFSLLDPKCFISINKDIESIHRIKHITLHDVDDNSFKLPNNVTHTHNNSVSKSPDVIEQEKENDFDIDNFINQICEENSILKMKDTLKPSRTNAKCVRIIGQLERDFERAKQHDENGRLSIHNAVLSNNIYLVQRQLIVLKLRKENVDIPTENGETSLELAIKYDICSEIVKVLLEAGAQPVLPKHTHESAVIIASKQSSPLLPMLISQVSNSKLLDQIDSEGFAALHYCSMHNNLQGAKALLSAGVTIDLKDMKSGRTALFHAVDNSHISVAQALLQAGAIANVPNFAGQTPLLVTEKFLQNNFGKET
ncbi:B-cell lymphoma 3 protein-like protein [Ooceraea biroi]|uniref:B-cell lymphoma 3 protein-like protein n=1 Tax=Ooceraea biroi TaxID=2015173 RepID=A0A026WRT4_OOCBI|nr:B-cell lymphoma 3 protein-like protein [Ooceraea biroi]